MCGIFGYVGTRNFCLRQATDIIDYRGPDADGFLHFNLETGDTSRESSSDFAEGHSRVALGFRRLAIIDLDARSNQPFTDPSQRFHIVFNGEIYNYLELRDELTKCGYEFRTASDTEVLLNAYIEWGTDCLRRLNGMWAFAILDTHNREMFCARDRFGIKPVYYACTPDGVYFASEVKQLFAVGVPKKVNTSLIRDYIDQRILDHTEESFFEGVHQLPAAHYCQIKLDAPLRVRPERYWRLEAQEQFAGMSYVDAQEEFRRLFYDSVRVRFRSDVQVGVCLSGGLDSSSVVAAATNMFPFPIDTFTSQFQISEFDETEYANLLPAMYEKLRPSYCSPTEDTFLGEFEKILFHLDEPFTHMTNIARWEVMKLVKDRDVTVVLNGQGADELLGGYRKFYAFYLKEKLLNRQFVPFLREFLHVVKNREFNFFDVKEFRRYLTNADTGRFYTETGKSLPSRAVIGLGGASTMNERCVSDVEKYSYPVLLRYEDRLSMAFSLETRIPFMDFRLVEFLYTIPSDFKIRGGYTKAIMRDSLSSILPRRITTRLSKLGFATPETIWMATSLRPFFQDYFRTMSNPWIDGKAVGKEFEKYPSKTRMSAYFFFSVFCFDRWYQSHFGDG